MSEPARSMRRRMRLRVLLAGAVLPLALWAVLPVFSQGAASPSGRLNDIERKIERHAGQDRAPQGDRAAADDPDQRLLTAHRPAAEPHRHPSGPAGQRPGRPRRQARRALPDPARPARRAPAPRAPARPPGPGPHGAGRAPRRALPGRQARHRHRDHVLQGLRRPARARRVHGARLPAGPEHHQDRARRQGRRDGDGQAPGQAGAPPAAADRDRPAPSRRDRALQAGPHQHAGRPGQHAGRQGARAGLGARRAQAAGGQPLGPQGRAVQDPGHAPAGAGQPPGRPDQARQRQPHLAGERPDHVAVLRAPRLGVVPSGHRHRRPRGHADPRRRRPAGSR